MGRKLKITKKILSVFLCTPVLLSCVPMSVISASAEDLTDLTVTIDTGASVTLKDADADSYYDIGTADELYAFAYAVNGGDKNINGELTADIVVNDGTMSEETDSTSVRHWTPIGIDYYIAYYGTFDGNNHTVSGLYFNNSEKEYVGLFGYNRGATIKNLGVVNSCFNANDYVGGVVGFDYFDERSTITNCYNTGIVSGNSDVGGVVGYSGKCTIIDCYNTGIVSGNSDVGGVVGYANYNTTITNSYNVGIVNCSNTYVGGIAGYNYGIITSCYNTSKIIGYNYVGGITGFNYYAFTNCYNKGAVNGYNYVGGLVGHNFNNTIKNCYNEGTVIGNAKVGGVAGYSERATITNCYNTGRVNGDNNVGGVAGESSNIVKDSYNTGEISGVDNVGGVVGYARSFNDNDNNYNSGSISGNSNVGGVFGQGSNIKATNNWNIGSVSGNTNVGGVFGLSSLSTITNVYNIGTVSGTGDYVGGLAGRSGDTIANSYNTGVVSGDNRVGGIIGQDDGGGIKNSHNTGTVSGTGNYVGGLSGYGYAGIISNCYNQGMISGNDKIGGVAGYHNRKIINCYNIGVVDNYSVDETISKEYVGGVVGIKGDSATITNCYYLDTAYNGGIKGADIVGSAEKRTVSQFASGEVAYLLQAGVTAKEGEEIPEIWGQKIGTENYPVLDGDKVYIGYKSCNSTEKTYANTELYEEVPAHNYERGKCTVCKERDPNARKVSVTGDVALMLDETDDNIYVGTLDLQAGTYSFNLNDNGTTLGFNVSFTDTKTIDYSGGFKAPSKLNATGGRYTFTYNATTKKLAIEHEPVLVFGDVSGNGNIDLSDVILALKYIVGEITLDEEQSLRADVDSNGTISVLDAVLIQKMILEME